MTTAMHGKCSGGGGGEAGGGGNGFMLFGVKVITEGSFRKSVSMNNLSQYEHSLDSNNDVSAGGGGGYVSDDVVHPSGRDRERRRGVAWSEEEHKLFLVGLQKVGKGDWRGISRDFVKTRTPTQVASHAQKYFLRHRSNHNRRRRRSSLFDITSHLVLDAAVEDPKHQETSPQPQIIQENKNPTKNLEKFPIPSFPVAITPLMVPITTENGMRNFNLDQINQLNNSPRPIMPIPILPVPPLAQMSNLDLNKNNSYIFERSSLSLNLSIFPQYSPPPSNQQPSPPPPPPPPPSNQQPPVGRQVSTFQPIPSNFKGSGGESIISVA